MSDYWGVRPECGCVTAWLSGDDLTTRAEIKGFYIDMATTGRMVRITSTPEEFEELKVKLGSCPHPKERAG